MSLRLLVVSAAMLLSPPAFAGFWSRAAQAFDSSAAPVTLRAPDGAVWAHSSDDSQLIVSDRRGRNHDIDVFSIPELLASPDSLKLALTDSDGGLVGSWRVRVIDRDADVRDITIAARRDYRSRPGVCAESPNAAAIAWLDHGRQLLVVLESPPHSSCADLGAVRGYVLDVSTGAIANSYSAREFRRRFAADLGDRLIAPR